MLVEVDSSMARSSLVVMLTFCAVVFRLFLAMARSGGHSGQTTSNASGEQVSMLSLCLEDDALVMDRLG